MAGSTAFDRGAMRTDALVPCVATKAAGQPISVRRITQRVNMFARERMAHSCEVGSDLSQMSRMHGCVVCRIRAGVDGRREQGTRE